MSTHKIDPGSVIPFPCWLYYRSEDYGAWEWYSEAPYMHHRFTHYSDNAPDQPPLGEPAPEETDHKLQDLREAQQITRRPASDPTPSTPSLQSVAEGAAAAVFSALFPKAVDNPFFPWLPTLSSILTRHFAPLLTAREAETRDWIKWHGELQEKLQDAQAQIAEMDERIGRLEKELADEKKSSRQAIDMGVAHEFRLEAELTALRTRCEELEEDAKRYAFLRENPPIILAVYLEKKTSDGVRLVYHDGQELDSQIDAAIRAAREEGQQAHEKGEGA